MKTASWHQEGQIQVQTGDAFFRPDSQLARDLGVLAAAVYRATTGKLRVLDAMTGCGIRALRYSIEANADWVWANDANPEMGDLIQANLSASLQAHQFQVTHQQAQHVFAGCAHRQDYYDFVDVDSFGHGSTLLHGCLQATQQAGLIYFTSTDGRSLTGHEPDLSLRCYGTYARAHPASQEQALRILLNSLMQQANLQGRTIQPLFSLFQGRLYRVLVRLSCIQSQPASGFLGYCHPCGHYQILSWRQLNRARCPHHQPEQPLTLSGPLWLGPLHDSTFLAQMSQQAQAWGWQACQQILAVMQQEAHLQLPPYFYPLGEIGRRGGQDIPKRDDLIAILQQQGYIASPTHINPQAIKTNAPLGVCLDLAKICLQQRKI